MIITTKNIVVKAIYLCCSSSHWVQRDPATHRWQRKQLPRHWRMQTCPVMPLKLLYLQLSHRDSVYNLCKFQDEYSLDEISNDPITVRSVCVCVCVCVCARTCVGACMRACVHVCVYCHFTYTSLAVEILISFIHTSCRSCSAALLQMVQLPLFVKAHGLQDRGRTAGGQVCVS